MAEMPQPLVLSLSKDGLGESADGSTSSPPTDSSDFAIVLPCEGEGQRSRTKVITATATAAGIGPYTLVGTVSLTPYLRSSS